MLYDAETLQELRSSGLLSKLGRVVEYCEDAETVEELGRGVNALSHVVDAISDLLLGLDN